MNDSLLPESFEAMSAQTFPYPHALGERKPQPRGTVSSRPVCYKESLVPSLRQRDLLEGAPRADSPVSTLPQPGTLLAPAI